MSTTFAPTTRRKLTLASAVTALSLTLVATGASGASAAGDRAVQGGTLTWGVKASFRSYITGFIANGSITASDGATKDAANNITFSGGNGALSADGTTHFAYKGAAHYYGHDGELDFTLSDPYLMVNSKGDGDLYMKYAVGKGAPKQIDIAKVSGGVPVVSGNIATVSNASTALTDAGVEVFSYMGHGFYPTGTVLDPVSANANLMSAPTSTPTSTKPAPTKTSTAPTSTTPVPTKTSSTPSSSATSTTPAPTKTSTAATSTAAPTTPVPTKTSTAPATSVPASSAPATAVPTQPATTPAGPATGPIVQTDVL